MMLISIGYLNHFTGWTKHEIETQGVTVWVLLLLLMRYGVMAAGFQHATAKKGGFGGTGGAAVKTRIKRVNTEMRSLY